MRVDKAGAVVKGFSERTRWAFQVRLQLAVAVISDLTITVAQFDRGHGIEKQVVQTGRGV